MKSRDPNPAEFDAADAWAIAGGYFAVNGHHGVAIICLVVVITIAFLHSRWEKRQ